MHLPHWHVTHLKYLQQVATSSGVIGLSSDELRTLGQHISQISCVAVTNSRLLSGNKILTSK